MLDLVVEDEAGWKLTESGITYAENVDASNPWIVDEIQAGVLRGRLPAVSAAAGRGRSYRRCNCSRLVRGFSNDDLGRALAERSKTEQWQADRTFESQGARYRELLIESGLIDRSGELTEQGVHSSADRLRSGG